MICSATCIKCNQATNRKAKKKVGPTVLFQTNFQHILQHWASQSSTVIRKEVLYE